MRSGDASMLEEILQDVKELKALHVVSHEEHVEHHEFIKQLINERKERAQIYSELREKLVVAGVLGAVGVLLTLLALGVRDWIKFNG